MRSYFLNSFLVVLALSALAGCASSRNDPFAGAGPTAALEPAGSLEERNAAFDEQPKPVQRVAHEEEISQPSPLPVPAAEPIASVESAAINAGAMRSLADLEAMALSNNPTIGQAEAEIDALRGKWVQVGLAPNPALGYSGEELGDEGTSGKQGAFLSQRFITGGKRGLRRAVVSQEIEQATQRYAAQRQRVLTDVRGAYYRALVARRRVEISKELTASAERASQAIKRLLDAGQSTRIDLLQAQVETETTAIAHQIAIQDETAALRRLSAVVGVADVQLSSEQGKLHEPPAVSDWRQSLQRLLIDSPERAAALVGIDRAEWNLDRNLAESAPDVDVTVGVQKDNASDDTITNVQVSMPLPLYDRNQGGIQQAEAEVVAAHRNAKRLELELQSRLAEVFRQLASSRLRAQRYRTALLPKSEETLRLVTTGYEAGELPYLGLLTAQRTYFRTNLEYLNALDDAWQAHVLVEGLMLQDSFGSNK